jgi:hypothetical protein
MMAAKATAVPGFGVMIILILCICAAREVQSFSLDDKFEEELFIKPLNNDFVYAYFQFTTTWNVPFEAKSCT